MFIAILIGFMIAGFVVQSRLRSKFEAYSKVPIATGLSGREVALKMLHDSGIHDVEVVSVPGKLTDHYDPSKKTVNLSPEVHNGRSVAAAAVAAHECGHAIQHAKAYRWLEFRSAMVPLVGLSSKAMNFIFLLLIFGSFANLLELQTLFTIIVILQAVLTLFTVVTLPVEYDASNRALVWLETAGITSAHEHDKAKDALKWAANTYLVAALAALTQLAYFVLMMLSGRD